jgi:hypothetical protein
VCGYCNFNNLLVNNSSILALMVQQKEESMSPGIVYPLQVELRMQRYLWIYAIAIDKCEGMIYTLKTDYSRL